MEGLESNALSRVERILELLEEWRRELPEEVEELQELHQRWLEQPLPLVVVGGGASSGKSRIVNRLVGEEVLPVGVRTRFPVELYPGEQPQLAYYTDSHRREVPVETFETLLREGRNYSRVVLVGEFPELATRQVGIAELPGWENLPTKRRSGLYRNYRDRGRLLIFLISADTGGFPTGLMDEVELGILEGKQVIIGITNPDRLPPAGVEELKGGLQQQLEERELEGVVVVVETGEELQTFVGPQLAKEEELERKEQLEGVLEQVLAFLNRRKEELEGQLKSFREDREKAAEELEKVGREKPNLPKEKLWASFANRELREVTQYLLSNPSPKEVIVNLPLKLKAALIQFADREGVELPEGLGEEIERGVQQLLEQVGEELKKEPEEEQGSFWEKIPLPFLNRGGINGKEVAEKLVGVLLSLFSGEENRQQLQVEWDNWFRTLLYPYFNQWEEQLQQRRREEWEKQQASHQREIERKLKGLDRQIEEEQRQLERVVELIEQLKKV